MTRGDVHLSADALLAYWLAEGSPADTDAAEEHLMRCDRCGEALDDLVALGQAVRAAFRDGMLWTVCGSAFAQRVTAAESRVREYRLPHNGTIHCTVAPGDEVLLARLAAPLQGVQRLDVLRESTLAPGRGERLEDVPFDPQAGEVVWFAKLARIRELPEHTMTVKLLAIEAAGSRELGTYTFRHRPWPGWPDAAATT